MKLSLCCALSVACYSAGLLLGAIASSACGAAATTYGAELLACVDSAQTRAEADACRSRVDARYGQTKDGGGE